MWRRWRAAFWAKEDGGRCSATGRARLLIAQQNPNTLALHCCIALAALLSALLAVICAQPVQQAETVDSGHSVLSATPLLISLALLAQTVLFVVDCIRLLERRVAHCFAKWRRNDRKTSAH